MAEQNHREVTEVSADNKKKAIEFKERANELFKQQDYDQAIDFYTKAIDLDDTEAVYFSNRSFAYLKLECFGYALQDASSALEIDPKYVKAYYRRASANMALGKFKLALKDFESVKKCRPNDKDARTKYQECKKIVTRIAFEKAISVDEKQVSIVEKLDLDSMTIEDEYKGPTLDDGKVTLQFMKDLMETYKKQQNLHRKYAYQILVDVKKLFMELPSLVEINVPEGKKFTVCGDIHGQFFDLMNIFELNGLPSEENPYLFNGDFVDRGSFSVECIFTLFGFRLLYPNYFFMSRGNHESSTMNKMYGFEGEVKSKYNAQMIDLFTEVYNWLPLCHTINNKIMVMHGGLFSDSEITLDDLKTIDRNRQPPDNGPMCELLWSDPQPQCGLAPSKRGIGVHFGPDVTENFLKRNNLDYIIRSHEVRQQGYEVAHNGKCITVFSAPNYCDMMGNEGAFITLYGHDLTPKFTTYKEVPHPNVRPMAYANSIMSLFS